MNNTVKPLNKEERDHYLSQMQRRAAAKALPSDQLDKYKAAYNELTAYLKQNYKGFICGYVLDHAAVPRNAAALKEAMDRAGASGLLDGLNDALDKGDSEVFSFLCWSLTTLYCSCVRDLMAS